MVGLIHKILFDLIKTTGGEDAVTKVRERAGIPPDREIKMQVAYDDAEWRGLVAATCEVLQITPQQAEEAYAAFFYKDALQRWPMWFTMSKNSREFLERQPAIHNSLSAGVLDEVARQAVADKFLIQRTSDGIITHYRSENRHCGLYKALARQIIEHYGDEAVIEEHRCQNAGAEECEIVIRWTKLGAA